MFQTFSCGEELTPNHGKVYIFKKLKNQKNVYPMTVL